MDDVLTRYLAGEIAEDHAAGRLSRREALLRLGKMGFGAVAASTLLAACGGGSGSRDAPDPVGAGPSSTAGTTDGDGTARDLPAGPGEVVRFPGNGVEVQGVFAPAAGNTRGAVLVIHENSGISSFVRAMVGRLAAEGCATLAVDLLSRAGGTDSVTATDASATLQSLAGSAVADMRSALGELERRAPGAKLGMCGFCFGGLQVWRMLDAGEPRLAAAVPCYGTHPDNPSFVGSRQAAVLAVYAENDDRVNASRESATAALVRDGLTHEVRTFPGVGHGFIRFFEDPANASHAQADAAYQAMVGWFARHLA